MKKPVCVAIAVIWAVVFCVSVNAGMTEKEVDEEIAVENIRLPFTNEQNVMQLQVIRIDKQIYFPFRFNEKTAVELHQLSELDKLKADLIKNTCSEADIKGLLDQGYSTIYIYFGKNNELVTEVPVVLNSCK